MISYGLVEAIFKRPESYASVSRSRGRDSRASGRGFESRASDTSGSVKEGGASGKASENGANSMGRRSPTESSSVSGQESADAEGSEHSRGRNPSHVIYESTPESTYPSNGPSIHEHEARDLGQDGDEDDVPTPGQQKALHGVTERHEDGSTQHHIRDETAPGVQVFY